MVTPLARRTRSIRRALAAGAVRCELNQVLRLCTLARLPVRIVADPSRLRRREEVVAVRLGRGQQPVEVTVSQAVLPAVVRDAGPAAVDAYVRLRHAVATASHPALQGEMEPSPADTPFARQLRAFAAVEGTGVDAEWAAFAAGPLRRGGVADLAGACREYFGVPVQLEALSAGAACLRVGPLSFAEYCEFHPNQGGRALAALRALAHLFLRPAPLPDVVLVLRAEEVPACVPGSAGAIAGFTCWPQTAGRARPADVEFHLRDDCFSGKVRP